VFLRVVSILWKLIMCGCDYVILQFIVESGLVQKSAHRPVPQNPVSSVI
jgi:hypothetical protein